MRKYFRSDGRSFLFVCLIVLAAGCGKREERTGGIGRNVLLADPPYVSKCEPGVTGGRLVIAQLGDPKTFNPITASETSSTDILLRMFASLVVVDVPTQEIIPGLAESWKVDADNKTWTFKLRKNLLWSDGHSLTADDVVFTWNVIYDPNINNVTRDQFLIDGKPFKVTTLDDVTVQIVTPEVYAPFLQFAGVVSILPKHKLAAAQAQKHFESAYGVNTKPEDLVSSGPYRLKQFKPAELTILERNPYYFVVDRKGQRLPYIDQLIFASVPDQNTMGLRFLGGQSDILELVRPEEVDRFKAESANGKFKLLDLGLATERDYFAFNQNTGTNSKTGKPHVDPVKLKWFRNTKFRQAVSYAVDRQAIIRSALAGYGEPNYNYAPSTGPWVNTNIHTYSYNPEKARALLAEIGMMDRNGDGVIEDSEGHPIEFVLISNTGNTRREKASVLIQQDLKKIGMKVTWQPLDFNALIDKLDSSFDWECYFLGWGGGPPDPAFGLNVLKSDGFSHQWFPRQKMPSTEWEARIDQLCNAQLRTLNFAERKKYYDEIQLILSEQQPMIFLTSMRAFSAVRADLQNVRASTLDPNRVIWNADELWLKK
jgi:peptide/nickel transport system substrate-binding protein